MLLEFKNSENCLFYNTDTSTLIKFTKDGHYKTLNNIDIFQNDEGYKFYNKNLEYVAEMKNEDKLPNIQTFITQSGAEYVVNHDDKTINGPWFEEHNCPNAKFEDILIKGCLFVNLKGEEEDLFHTSEITKVKNLAEHEYLSAMCGIPIEFPKSEKDNHNLAKDNMQKDNISKTNKYREEYR